MLWCPALSIKGRLKRDIVNVMESQANIMYA